MCGRGAKMAAMWLVPSLLAALTVADLQVVPPERPLACSIAAVVDARTWDVIQPSWERWRAAQAARGVGVTLVLLQDASAEVLRAELQRLSSSARIEGVVLCGEVPVPMLRGAQHLTSAFKMDEDRYPRTESSVPSDAYYADFDLVWTSLPREPADALRHYFELAPTSPQQLRRELWISRLGFEGPTAANQLADYLLARAGEMERGSSIEQGAELLDRVASFEGHGYVSESLDAWAGRTALWREGFPHLFGAPKGAAAWRAFHHLGSRDQLTRFVRELQDPLLDLVVVHAHGDVSSQLLLGEPEHTTVASKREAIQRVLRGRLRQAVARQEALEVAQARIAREEQVPLEWLDRALDPEQQRADEAHAAAFEVDVGEIATWKPQAKVALLDQCFNGAFAEPNDIATAWLSGGSTRVVLANSVNVLQDTLGEEHLGQVGQGEWLGRWHKRSVYLESQCLGDGTYGFASGRSTPVDPWSAERMSLDALRTISMNTSASASARELAVWLRVQQQDITLDELRQVLTRDPAASVRLQALAGLARTRSDAFAGALELAVRDSHELVRRKAVELMAERGETEHIALLAHAVLRDPSPRVVFDAREGLRWFDPRLVRADLEDYTQRLGAQAQAPDVRAELSQLMASAETAFADDLALLTAAKATTERALVNAVRTFRLYRLHRAVPLLLALAQTAESPLEARVAAVEALGWHAYNPEWPRLCEALRTLSQAEGTPARLRDECVKTIGRLQAGPNHPLTP